MIFLKKAFFFILFIMTVLFFWLLIGIVFKPEPWLLPPPNMVWNRFMELLADGFLLKHTIITLTEILMGYAVGVSSGLLIGYPISQVKMLERILTPYLIAGNSVPLVAFAPLLLLWFGSGMLTNIIVTALIVFLPMTISTITGFQAQKSILKRLMRTLKASKFQRFIYLEVPTAMPGIISGMKIGAPLAVVGAVVGEFLGSGEGLGHLILEANGLLDTSQLFVAIWILAIIGMTFFSLIQIIDFIILGSWNQRRQER
ncbi:MAG: hypothetical protein CR997_02140 [Acidobacteria bacterium]|nr:MAG: hypothetical protein CR997_02140 [Acidobacteriota bacterium]